MKKEKGYQPLNREALLASATKRWEENKERKLNLRAIEQLRMDAKDLRSDEIDARMARAKAEVKEAKALRDAWLLDRSEEWIAEEDLDLAIARAILEPHAL